MLLNITYPIVAIDFTDCLSPINLFCVYRLEHYMYIKAEYFFFIVLGKMDWKTLLH